MALQVYEQEHQSVQVAMPHKAEIIASVVGDLGVKDDVCHEDEEAKIQAQSHREDKTK